MSKLEWIEKEIGRGVIPNDNCIVNFYYKAMHDNNMSYGDADRYAWLNTLFGYDIGAEYATGIINWCYENGVDAFDVNSKNKGTMNNVCEFELGYKLDFSTWSDYEPEYLKFYV